MPHKAAAVSRPGSADSLKALVDTSGFHQANHSCDEGSTMRLPDSAILPRHDSAAFAGTGESALRRGRGGMLGI
jgi:hypothetical protein